MKAVIEIVELKNDVVTVSGAAACPVDGCTCYDPTVIGDPCFTDE